MTRQPLMRRWAAGLACTAAAIAGLAALAPAHAADPTVSPEIQHTRIGPTGYSVTFRFDAPTATSVRIKGEWSFATPAAIAADPTNAHPDLPNDWKPGDIPVPSPLAGSTSNWPVADMARDADGVWTYTIPLPAGTFNYAFYVDCSAAAPLLTGCTPLSDPANAPWTNTGTTETTSQVYVPGDPQFDGTDLSWQAPVPAAAQGTLQHVTYPVPGHTSPTDKNYLSVYLPPGYDPNRAQAYPTFYLIHGGGGNEMDWTTQGAGKNILDNLLAQQKIRPTVVVMGNNPSTDEILSSMIPWVQAHYNVSTSADDRMLAGLSGGATNVQDILYNHTTSFGYYAVWSAPRGIPTAGEEKNPELKQLKGLMLAVGKQDLGGLAQGNTTAEQKLLTDAGVPFRSYNIDGAHTWSFWRDAMRDFLTTVVYPQAKPVPPITPAVSKPQVAHQPKHKISVKAGKKVKLAASASGSPAPTVQWQRKVNGHWRNIAGATKAAYAFKAKRKLNKAHYRAVFTNQAGSAVSATAVLKIKNAR